MQILPTSSANDTFGFFGTTQESAGDFYSAMSDALASVKEGDNFSADNALQEEPLVESPYTRHTTDGVTYTMAEVLFSKSELAELRVALLKEGAPEETLKQFDILADQPNGATLAQVMASLVGQANTPKLDENDEHLIVGFLGQIDPTGDLAKDVLAKMKEGNGLGALELIQNAMGRETVDLGLQEALALGKGLGLNNDSLRQITEGFGGQSGLALAAAQFDKLMTPAKNQFMQEAASMSKLEAALDKTLRPIISKARDRMEKEKLASEKESRRVQQSRILIDKTVQANSREMIDETVAARDKGEAGKTSRMTGHAGEAVKENAPKLQENLQASNAENVVNAKGAVNAMQANAAAGQNVKEDAGENSKGKKDGWNDLLGKVETKTAPQPSAAASVAYSMLQGEMEMEPAAWTSLGNLETPLLPQQVAQQVEQGLLTAMRDGSTRLDLQLHPAELGSVAITLIARNGEVTALIRSEKTETAEMMQRQADTIRVNLEQQGVRVDKIEVQLENRQDSAQNSFQDLDQHNARQEEEARRQELARLRNLASLRNSRDFEDGSALAQSMHNIGQTARYAGSALHVVA